MKVKAYQVNTSIPTPNGQIEKNSRLLVRSEGQGAILAEVIPPNEGEKWPLEAHASFIANSLKAGLLAEMPLPALTA